MGKEFGFMYTYHAAIYGQHRMNVRTVKGTVPGRFTSLLSAANACKDFLSSQYAFGWESFKLYRHIGGRQEIEPSIIVDNNGRSHYNVKPSTTPPNRSVVTQPSQWARDRDWLRDNVTKFAEEVEFPGYFTELYFTSEG